MSPITAPPKKIRGDAKLQRLSPEQQECVRHWLEEENHTYAEVARRVHATFGIAISKSAIGAYYKRHLLPERYDDDADAAADLAALPLGEFDAATIKHAKALAFSALTDPYPRIETAGRLLDIVHRVHKQQIAEKRLALDERRVALREALATHPPRRPRAGPSARDTHAPDPAAQSPTPSHPTPPPSSTPSPDSSLPPLGHPPTPGSSLPSLPSAQSLPPPPPASQKSPPNPPLFPASSSLSKPSAPLAQPPKPTPPKPRLPYRDPTLSEYMHPE